MPPAQITESQRESYDQRSVDSALTHDCSGTLTLSNPPRPVICYCVRLIHDFLANDSEEAD